MFQQSGGFSRYSAYLRGRQQRTRIYKVIIFLSGFFLILGFLAYAGVSTIRIEGSSMAPALNHGDRGVVSPYPYGIRTGFSERRFFSVQAPARGDLILTRPAYNTGWPRWLSGIDSAVRIISFQLLSLDPFIGGGRGDEWIVRRIVGLPGDTLYVKDGWCYIQSAGGNKFLREDELAGVAYVPAIPEEVPGWNPSYPGPYSYPLTLLGDNDYFVMADNRLVIDDSRLWGTLPESAIIGQMNFVYWPLNMNNTSASNP